MSNFASPMGSYYSNDEGTFEYDRYWTHAHNQIQLGLFALEGIDAKKLDEDWDLDDDAENGLRRYVDECVLIRAVDNFQTYVVELLTKIFSQRPEMISGSKIEAKAIFELGDIDDLKR